MVRKKTNLLLGFFILIGIFFQSISHARIKLFAENNLTFCKQSEIANDQKTAKEISVSKTECPKKTKDNHTNPHESSNCNHGCINCIGIINNFSGNILFSYNYKFINSQIRSFIKSFSNQLFRPPITA